MNRSCIVLLHFIVTICLIRPCHAQKKNAHLLKHLLRKSTPLVKDVIKNKEQYEIQIIYTRIDRDAANKPTFTPHYFNVDPKRYYYPASTVKMPTALMALERLNELKIPMESTMLSDSAYYGQACVLTDSTAENNLPSVEHYIKRIFLVSDNDAYNRLYEFLGQHTIQKKLKQKGYDDARIITRLSIALTMDENRHTNPVTFINKKGDTLYHQPMQFNEAKLPIDTPISKGIGYYSGDDLVKGPMDFGSKNFIPLESEQIILRAILFPEETDMQHQFNITKTQRNFVWKYMSEFPRESHDPSYPLPEYYDSYCKYLLYGSDKNAEVPDYIRIFNKIGQAYGYLTDNAYVIDTKHKVEFLLSAVILVNKNQIFNDGEYEYDTIGFPYMRDLGKTIYQYELRRKRKNIPDLSEFILEYDK